MSSIEEVPVAQLVEIKPARESLIASSPPGDPTRITKRVVRGWARWLTRVSRPRTVGVHRLRADRSRTSVWDTLYPQLASA